MGRLLQGGLVLTRAVKLPPLPSLEVRSIFKKRCKQGKLLSWADSGSSPALTAGIAADPSAQSPE